MSCTVTQTIFKKCENDWISKNGTCYEDSCCTSFETATSWYYRLAQFSHIFFSTLAIHIIPIYLKIYAKKHMLSHNIRIFVNITLFFIFVHSIDMIAIHVYHIYQSFLAREEDPCFVRVRVDFCAPMRNVFGFCLLALGATQFAIYIDRLICIFYSEFYLKHQKIVLAVLVWLIILVPFLLILWVFRNQDSQSYLLSCINIPKASIRDMTYGTAGIFPVNVCAFFLSIFLFRMFRKREKGSRFYMSRHFKDVIDVQSSEFLFKLTATQGLFIVLYPICSFVQRIWLYNDFKRSVHLTFATLSYIFSIYCFVIPLVMIQYVRGSQKLKKDRIFRHVTLKSIGSEGADNYFNSLKNQWG